MLHPDLKAFQRVATTGEGRGIEGAIERGIDQRRNGGGVQWEWNRERRGKGGGNVGTMQRGMEWE